MYQTKSISVLLREQNSTYSIFKLTQTSHPYWINCTTLCHGRCLCCHIISSTTVKSIPSLSQEIVTYSSVCWLYCVSSRPLVLSTNKREGRARFCMETFQKCADDQSYKAGGLVHSGDKVWIALKIKIL